MTDEAKKTFGALRLLVALALLLTIACGQMAQRMYLGARDREIESATKAIEAARDDGERAARHSDRARAYSEKARYSKVFKLITGDEYGRLFGLAIEDHDRAVALAPGNAQTYFDRGLTYYDRAALEDLADPKTKGMFDAAAADFKSTIERDPRNARAFDMLGLVHTSTGEHDQAIADFAQEMAIDPHLGRLRLAEAYCTRGSSHQKPEQYDAAISDYKNAIALGVPPDGCDCQPESPLVQLYMDTKQYDNAWAVVKRARAERKWIDPALIDQLKKASGRVQ
jgi:tetratricopeptide (TPR) repeat protein